MRMGYSSVGGGESFASYSLTRRDLEVLVAEHFGFDPSSVNIEGLEMPGLEFHVSGNRTVDPDQDAAYVMKPAS